MCTALAGHEHRKAGRLSSADDNRTVTQRIPTVAGKPLKGCCDRSVHAAIHVPTHLVDGHVPSFAGRLEGSGTPCVGSSGEVLSGDRGPDTLVGPPSASCCERVK